MQPSNRSAMQHEQLRSVITGFIHQLQQAGGGAITHVAITVHGETQHFSTSRAVHDVPVTKIRGVSRLSYQELPVSAALPNRVTIIATENAVPAT